MSSPESELPFRNKWANEITETSIKASRPRTFDRFDDCAIPEESPRVRCPVGVELAIRLEVGPPLSVSSRFRSAAGLSPSASLLGFGVQNRSSPKWSMEALNCVCRQAKSVNAVNAMVPHVNRDAC